MRNPQGRRFHAFILACAVYLTVMAAIIVLAPRPAEAGDPDFGDFVKRLEREYRIKKKSIPFFWVAKAVVRIGSPAGVSRLDLAIFEEQDLRPLLTEIDLQDRVHGFLGGGWKPFVEVNERNGERVLLYARQKGKNYELFVLSLEHDEGVAVLTRVDPEALQRAIEDPPAWARAFR